MSNKPELLLVNSFDAETVEKLDSLYNTHHLWELSTAQQRKLIESLEGRCTAAATGSWACDDIIYELDSLQMISCFGVGVDAIRFDITSARQIRVTNTPEVLNDSVADIALALILNTALQIGVADRFVREQSWQQGPFPLGNCLAGKTLGIVGLGRIGEAVVHRALPFGLKVAYHNRTPKNLPYTYYPSLEELATASDILLCLLPGGESTRKIIDGSVFKKLGPQGFFINVGRGTSVDEQALAEALHSGQIAGAGLDVYENEPNIPESLLQAGNLVLLPHIGSATIEARHAMGNLLIKNLDAYFANEPLLSEVKKN